jgi:hypothetical protein
MKNLIYMSALGRAAGLLPLALLLTLPAVVQAQFNYTTANGTITITGYTGPGGAVDIPSTINGLAVTTIGESAFFYCTSLTSVTIPNSVTSIGIGDNACGDGLCWGTFSGCTSLTNVKIGNSVTNIGAKAFLGCTSLTGVTIPNSVTNIGLLAFYQCTSLTTVAIGSSVTNIGYRAFGGCTSLSSVTIPNSVISIGAAAFEFCTSLISVTISNSVTNIGDLAFFGCTSLTGIYCKGNTPSVGPSVFEGANTATVYYLPGTTGWGATFAGRPTALWVLPYPLILNNGPSFGVQTNGFGFIISWATNNSVVVEASPDLSNPAWTPVSTNTLTGASSYFSDPQWTNHPTRFYRLRSP